MKILIVDDAKSTRKVIKSNFTAMGYTDFEEAPDGLEAWRILEKKPIDLVITDWIMPHMDGKELLKKIRSHDSTSKIPVIMVTSEGMNISLTEIIKDGINGYINKPFEIHHFVEKMQTYLEEFKIEKE